MSLDVLDRQLIDMIQSDFPLAPEPFRVLGDRLGLSAQDVIERLARLQQAGHIRQIGPVFDLKKLGFTSSLCAAKVDPAHLDEAVAFINGFDEVTHNYLRGHAYNVWFTLIAPTSERIAAILDKIRSVPGVADVVSLPAERTFKIKVHFATAGDAS